MSKRGGEGGGLCMSKRGVGGTDRGAGGKGRGGVIGRVWGLGAKVAWHVVCGGLA